MQANVWTTKWTRLAALGITVAGFAVLYRAAKVFGGDYAVLGFSDDMVRAASHFMGYGMLALLLSAAMGHWRLATWLIILLLAGTDEIHQLFIPGRYCSLGDWTINVAGVTCFLSVDWLFGAKLQVLLAACVQRIAGAITERSARRPVASA